MLINGYNKQLILEENILLERGGEIIHRLNLIS
jgi:hypothetical protein